MDRTTWERVRRRLLLCVLVMAGVLAGLFLAEFALRTMGFGNPIVYRTNSAYRFAPRPDQRVERRRWGGRRATTINESGYRSTESWKKNAAFKVLWLGDSVTWGGTYIDDTETFAELSCGRIEVATGLEVVCANGGVNAYGVDNIVSRLHYDRAGADANVVVVVVSWKNFFRSKSSIGGNPFLTYAPPSPVRALREVAANASARLLVKLQWSPGLSCDDPYRMAVVRKSLAELLQVLRKKQDEGKTVLLARYVEAREVEEHNNTRKIQWCIPSASAFPFFLDLEEQIHISGVPYLDLTNAVREAAKTDSAEPIFLDRGGHLQVRGHQVYAQAIGDKVLELTGYANE